jgi:hypothetical protein
MGQSAMLPDAQPFSMEKTRSFTPRKVGIPLIANPISSGLKKNWRIKGTVSRDTVFIFEV